MSDITPGHAYNPGDFVDAPDLNKLVGQAVINPSLIDDKILKDPVSLSDKMLINDNGVLKATTIQQIIDQITPVILNAAIPVGVVTSYVGTAAPNSSWLFCFGQLLDRDVYSDLFTAIGTTFGVGDGTTTFQLPDYRGRVLAGKNNMGGVSNGLMTTIVTGGVLGAVGGAEQHALTLAQIPSHTHNLPFPAYPVSSEGGSVYGLSNGGAFAGRVEISSAAQNTGPAGGGAIHPNVQPTSIVNVIIKVLP